MPQSIDDFIVKKIEYWTLKPSYQESVSNFELSNLFKQKDSQNPYSNYRNNPVYYLPKDMKVKDINVF